MKTTWGKVEYEDETFYLLDSINRITKTLAAITETLVTAISYLWKEKNGVKTTLEGIDVCIKLLETLKVELQEIDELKD